MNRDIFKGGDIGFRFLRTDLLADFIGIPEAPLRFFIGIVVGFPFAFIYLLLPKNNSNLKNSYIASCGILISYFCFGRDCVYSLICILITYVSLVLFGGTIYNVIFSFIFQMGYLIAAYLYYASDGYDVKWTTPQCILCLRLIGLAWDCYDGQQKKENLSEEVQKTCYKGTPTFLEILGYSYFFGAFMAGPQFSFQRYLKFIDDTLVDDEGREAPGSRFFASLKRFVAGAMFFVVFVKYDYLYQVENVLTDEFKTKTFFEKSTQIMLTYHIHFCKYIGIWMWSESICMITGLSYNGVIKGKVKWDGVQNFKFRKCVFGPFFQDMLEGFNINTSQWAGRYVFRRLRFLGNKTVSHILTLLFLSIWHGFYVGYFILFSVEFFLIIGERQLCGYFKIIFNSTYNEQPAYIKIPIRICGILFRAYSCGFAATAFMLLRWRRIKIVYSSVYYWVLVAITLWYLVIGPLLSIVVQKRKRSLKEDE